MNKWIPHNYQLTAMSFLISNPRSALFLDPGLGKTSTTLAASKILMKSGSISSILLIAPLRVTYSVWPNEIEKWLNFNDMSCTILHDKNKPSLWGPRKDFYLINPEGIEWLHGELLRGLKSGKKCPFNTLWIDESTKFKSHESQRFQYVCDMLPLFKRRHIMTGTPAPRSYLDLWSQMYILDEGKALGHNFYEFRRDYFEANDWNKYDWKLKDFADKQIQGKISHLVLEMSAEDYLDIPELVFNDIRVDLPSKALSNYKKMERDFFLQLDGMEASAVATADSFIKCNQIANGRVYEDIPDDLDEDEIREFKKNRKVIKVHTSKQEAIKDLVDEMNGRPLLIAYYFKHDLEALREVFGQDIPYIGSGVKAARAKELEKLWNEGKLPILAGNPASMAHGLNMQEKGNDICWYSMTWDLEAYIQFIKRIHRQGVRSKVTCHHIIANDTLDEAMLSRLGEKAEQQTNLRKALREFQLRGEL